MGCLSYKYGYVYWCYLLILINFKGFHDKIRSCLWQ
jgi:hypothetical protein